MSPFAKPKAKHEKGQGWYFWGSQWVKRREPHFPPGEELWPIEKSATHQSCFLFPLPAVMAVSRCRAVDTRSASCAAHPTSRGLTPPDSQIGHRLWRVSIRIPGKLLQRAWHRAGPLSSCQSFWVLMSNGFPSQGGLYIHLTLYKFLGVCT